MTDCYVSNMPEMLQLSVDSDGKVVESYGNDFGVVEVRGNEQNAFSLDDALELVKLAARNSVRIKE